MTTTEKNGFKKWTSKKLKICSILNKTDLIIEVADARIINSTTNMFDYRQFKALRIIYFNFQKLSNYKITNTWKKLFKKNNIITINEDYFDSNDLSDLINQLVIDNKLPKKQRYLISLVGSPAVGKKTLINKTIKNNKKQIKPLLGKLTMKSTLYDVNDNIQLIDTVSILRDVDDDDFKNSIYNLQILNKINLWNINDVILATTALIKIITVNKEIIENHYHIKITENEINKIIKTNDGLAIFEKIAINWHITNEFGLNDYQIAAKQFLNLIQNFKIKNYSLEQII